MATQSHPAFLPLPDALHWDAQAIADAVPLRLFELDLFDAGGATHSANREEQRSRRATYLPAAASLFRIR